MERIETDLCILGAGSGGLSIAAGAVQMGARVVLIEGGRMGGDCLNYGCVPSKALIAAGKRAQAMRNPRAFGITPVEPVVDYAAAMDHVRRAIATIEPHDSQERFEGLGVRVIRAYGRFVSDSAVAAGETRITARRFVIATGSRPFLPPIDGLAETPHLTNETLFDLRERPEHLLVLGAGPVGLEMAQAHRRLGCEVTVVEAMSALGQEDPEMAAIALEQLRKDGVEIQEHTIVERVSGGEGKVLLKTSRGELSGSHLLVAAGRAANVERLDLNAAGVEFDRRGVEVNDSLRTTNRRIYAIGDVAAGQMNFTHVAGYHAGVIARSILFGLPARAKSAHIPHVTYTDPEIAHIGLTEEDARRRHGDGLEVVRFPYSQSDRAIADGQTDGLIKVMVHRGRPVGVSIAGHQAGELIAPWALMMANGLKMKALSDTVLPYPTLAEVGKRAAGAYFSPRLFESAMVKKVVRLIQRHIP